MGAAQAQLPNPHRQQLVSKEFMCRMQIDPFVEVLIHWKFIKVTVLLCSTQLYSALLISGISSAMSWPEISKMLQLVSWQRGPGLDCGFGTLQANVGQGDDGTSRAESVHLSTSVYDSF